MFWMFAAPLMPCMFPCSPLMAPLNPANIGAVAALVTLAAPVPELDPTLTAFSAWAGMFLPIPATAFLKLNPVIIALLRAVFLAPAFIAAPESAKPLLISANRRSFGFTPNLDRFLKAEPLCDVRAC